MAARGSNASDWCGIHDVPADLARAASIDDAVEALISRVRRELLDGIATLADELARNRIATLAWMIRDGLLEVRVAAPSALDERRTEGGVFHNKRYVFRDAQGRVITADGSPNETVMGLGANFEELTVHMSWRDHSDEYTRAHVESFEMLWDNNQPGVRVVPLESSFAEELLRALSHPIGMTAVPPRVEPSIVGTVLDAAIRSPAYPSLTSGPPRSTPIKNVPSWMRRAGGRPGQSWPMRWDLGRPWRRPRSLRTPSGIAASSGLPSSRQG